MGCCGSEQVVTAGGVNGVVHQVQHLPPLSVRLFTEGYGQSRHSIAAVALCGSDQSGDLSRLPGAQDSIHWVKRSQAMTRVLKDQMLALCVGTICLVSLVWLELVA